MPAIRSQFGGSATWLHVILVVAAGLLVAPYFGIGAYLSSHSHSVERAYEVDSSSELQGVSVEIGSDRRTKTSAHENPGPPDEVESDGKLSDLDELLAR